LENAKQHRIFKQFIYNKSEVTLVLFLQFLTIWLYQKNFFDFRK